MDSVNQGTPGTPGDVPANVPRMAGGDAGTPPLRGVPGVPTFGTAGEYARRETQVFIRREETAMEDRDPETGRFLPGNSGFGGRPKGARNKLGEEFLADLQKLWHKEGAAALKEARDQKPIEFVKVVASLLPKELLLRKDPVDELTDEEIADALDILRGLVARGSGDAGKAPH